MDALKNFDIKICQRGTPNYRWKLSEDYKSFETYKKEK